MCEKSFFLASSGFIMGMLKYLALGQLSIFKAVQHAEVCTYIYFYGILDQEVLSWT